MTMRQVSRQSSRLPEGESVTVLDAAAGVAESDGRAGAPRQSARPRARTLRATRDPSEILWGAIRIAIRHVARAMRAMTTAEVAAPEVPYVYALAASRRADRHLMTAWPWIETEQLIRHAPAILYLAWASSRSSSGSPYRPSGHGGARKVKHHRTAPRQVRRALDAPDGPPPAVAALRGVGHGRLANANTGAFRPAGW